ncbi:MAG: hypothetical protein MI865_07480 [Proteobacteria bacterium]|nr:hypothetical protein [Pseudomonadota bacterium]
MLAHILRYSVGALILVAQFFQIAHAGENLWVYTRGTDTRPKGTYEAKLNYIARIDKDSGSYAFHDIRPEIEYGFTNKFTMSGALLIFHHDFSGIEVGNDPVHETQEANGGSVNQTVVGGFEIKAKYNILSPYKDFMGLSVGLAYERRNNYRLDGADIDQDSIVPQIFLQKNFLDDTLVFAVLGKMELERRVTPGVLEEEIAFEVAAGVSYRVAPKWYVGFEFRHQSDYLCVEEDGIPEAGVECSEFDFFDWNVGDQFQNGNYVGPSIHYAEQKWFATLGVVYQIFGGGDNAFNKGNRNFDEHEKYHVGFHLGYNF